jgi:hypothetical protein
MTDSRVFDATNKENRSFPVNSKFCSGKHQNTCLKIANRNNTRTSSDKVTKE